MKRTSLKRKTPLRAKTGLQSKGWWRPKRKKKRRSDYVTDVWQHTHRTIGGYRPPGMTIDHLIPISYGEKHGIPPELIGGPENLRWMPLNDNIQKGTRIFTDEQYALLEAWGFPAIRPSDLTRTMEGRNGV